MRFPVWVLLAGLTAGCSFAQDATQSQASAAKTCRPYSHTTPFRAWNTVMKGMPYRGKRVLRCEETLHDGTIIKGKESFLEWRDSLGRFRSQALDPEFEGFKLYEVQVNDPVDHVRWQWDEGKDSSHQTLETKYKFRHEYAQWQTDYHFARMLDPGPNFKQVLLDPIWINGVYAKGAQDMQLCQPGQYGNKTDHPSMPSATLQPLPVTLASNGSRAFFGRSPAVIGDGRRTSAQSSSRKCVLSRIRFDVFGNSRSKSSRIAYPPRFGRTILQQRLYRKDDLTIQMSRRG